MVEIRRVYQPQYSPNLQVRSYEVVYQQSNGGLVERMGLSEFLYRIKVDAETEVRIRDIMERGNAEEIHHLCRELDYRYSSIRGNTRNPYMPQYASTSNPYASTSNSYPISNPVVKQDDTNIKDKDIYYLLTS